MGLALRRVVLLLVLGGALNACDGPAVGLAISNPAAVVDGHEISMKTYQARLEVSRHRDPFAGIPEAIPSPAPTQRLEDFTIEQLVREEIVRQEAVKRGLSISDQAVKSRIDSLRARAGAAQFTAALSRNGFTDDSFRAYERALLTEVGLIQAMARDRASTAAQELKSGHPFVAVAARWSDDTGTFSRGGDTGWLRTADIPEPALATAVEPLATGGTTGWARPPGSRNRSTTKRRRSAGLEKSTSRSPTMPADEGERWRVFLAIETPVPVREALTGPLDGLQPLREAIRTNAVDRMHLTLHFLGHQPRPVVDLLQETLAAVVARHPRFRLTAEGVGAFPAISRPRVLWAGIIGGDLPRLHALQSELGGALRNAGVAVEGDRFHPHLTLGRVRRPLRAPERALLREWSLRWSESAFGQVPVDHIRLMRSQLGGGPPRYTTLATFDLQ
ncbi:MAG: RNA 2',3'-cyclic phosphodiesterase [Chloroflexi bacterium]|nr:MAG: RNA 2',3'-cyclic phosphodiesterase [Chloroflexota bacterium]